MVTMATITTVGELEVRDHSGLQYLEPPQPLHYNGAIDLIRENEYPMLKGEDHHRSSLFLLTHP